MEQLILKQESTSLLCMCDCEAWEMKNAKREEEKAVAQAIFLEEKALARFLEEKAFWVQALLQARFLGEKAFWVQALLQAIFLGEKALARFLEEKALAIILEEKAFWVQALLQARFLGEKALVQARLQARFLEEKALAQARFLGDSKTCAQLIIWNVLCYTEMDCYDDSKRLVSKDKAITKLLSSNILVKTIQLSCSFLSCENDNTNRDLLSKSKIARHQIEGVTVEKQIASPESPSEQHVHESDTILKPQFSIATGQSKSNDSERTRQVQIDEETSDNHNTGSHCEPMKKVMEHGEKSEDTLTEIDLSKAKRKLLIPESYEVNSFKANVRYVDKKFEDPSSAMDISEYKSPLCPADVSIVAYPLYTVQQGAQLKQNFKYEFLRLSSFNIQASRMPGSDSSITEIAAAGFYLSGPDGQVTCFSCSKQHENFLTGIRVQSAHAPQCHWQETNIPINRGTEGLRPEELNEFKLLRESSQPQTLPPRISAESSVASVSGHMDDIDGNRFGRYEPAVRDLSLPDTPPFLVTNMNSIDSSNPASEMNFGTVVPDAIPFSHHEQAGRHGLPSLNIKTISQESSNSPHIVLTSATATAPHALRSQEMAVGDGTEANGATAATVINLSGASYPQFATREARRETYKFWDSNHKQKPEDLINLGFFFSGYIDCARCFYCGLGLKYWRPNDDAAYQHSRFRPHCLYNRLVNGQEFIDRVLVELFQEEKRTTRTNTNAAGMTHLLKTSTAMESFKNEWSEVDVKEAFKRLMQPNGNFGGGFPTYATFLPVLENIRKEKQPRSQVPGDATASVDPNITENTEDDGTECALLVPPVKLINTEERLWLVEKEHTYLHKKNFCNICDIANVGCVFLPCGHAVACQECGDSATTCVYCNRHISALANVYLA